MSEDFNLWIENLTYRVQDGLQTRTLLRIAHFRACEGEKIGIKGMSGSGKSTWLKLLSGIVVPQEGVVRWGSDCISTWSEAKRDDWRGLHCGFLFQDFRLFDGLSALDNVLLPITFRRRLNQADRQKGRDLLEKYGVKSHTRACVLSRGEMQRVALVRLLMVEPKVILADEPTASLDQANGQAVMQALMQTADVLRATLFVVTHDLSLLKNLDRVVSVRDGQLFED